MQPHEVQAPPLSPAPFQDLLEPAAWEDFQRGLERARRIFHGRVIWNVNSTAAGGGVAEMLRSFISYSRGAELDVRWVAIEGTPEFFIVTKRLHNFLHGEPGDGGELGPAERDLYERITAANAEELSVAMRKGDIVILHDPQTAGLVSRLKATGVTILWRSHVGAEGANDYVHTAWDFLAPYVEQADACIFSRHAYVPPWAEPVRTMVIQPSIDAFSPKNQEIDSATVRAILAHVGLIVDDASERIVPLFNRYDGTRGRVDRRCEVLSTGPPPHADLPLVTQVSRWDRLKDHRGVMEGFVRHVIEGTDAHLVLAGPNVHGVADDPEGAEVLNEVEAAWRELPHLQRSRVHLACLPMADIDENAAIVNALQRHAAVVAQKSIQEGFGLTVAEAMWKNRPVVASAVGGIRDQIKDGETGLLIDDPHDLEAFGLSVLRLLGDPELGGRLGRAAHEYVRRYLLANRHSLQYIELLSDVLGEGAGARPAESRGR